VIFSDNNPFSRRSTSVPFTPANQDSFSGMFDGGYPLHTNSGQGANPDAGFYIVPSAANTAATSSPAFVGINNPDPTAALDVVGNAVVNGNSVVVGQEPLRTLRGRVNSGGGIQNGSGFTPLRVALGHYRITFNTAFSNSPTPVATAFNVGSRESMTVSQVSTKQFEVRSPKLQQCGCCRRHRLVLHRHRSAAVARRATENPEAQGTGWCAAPAANITLNPEGLRTGPP